MTSASTTPLQCRPICFTDAECPDPARRCDLAFSNLDPFTRESLGLCALVD